MQRVEQATLNVDAMALGIISEEDWNSYKEEQKMNSVKLKNYLREKRR